MPGTVIRMVIVTSVPGPLAQLLFTGGHHYCLHSQIRKLRHREANKHTQGQVHWASVTDQIELVHPGLLFALFY